MNDALPFTLRWIALNQGPATRVALNLCRVLQNKGNTVALANSACWQGENFGVVRFEVHRSGLQSCWRNLLWSFHAIALTYLQQNHTQRMAWFPCLPRRQIRNSCLPTASSLCKLALRDALFGKCRDVFFPLHEIEYIGLPILKQAVCRYRNSVCL